jgi:hypothetical protein
MTNNNKHQVSLCLSVHFFTGLSVSLSACSSCICAFIVKNQFGLLQMLYFHSNVIGKSYKQVLTPFNNSQLLLKLEIPDKFRLVTNPKIQHKGNQHFLVHTGTGEMGVLMTLNHRASA